MQAPDLRKIKIFTHISTLTAAILAVRKNKHNPGSGKNASITTITEDEHKKNNMILKMRIILVPYGISLNSWQIFFVLCVKEDLFICVNFKFEADVDVNKCL